MKTIFKMILPVAAFALASAGAVNTTGAKTAKADGSVLISGWVQNPDQNTCSEREDLDCKTTSGTPVCMSADSPTKQVFNLTPAGKCSVQLYKVIH